MRQGFAESGDLLALLEQSWSVRLMSALPPKADIDKRGRHVRFVPKADICTAANKRLSRTNADGFLPRVRAG
jgi:hypothetical protein